MILARRNHPASLRLKKAAREAAFFVSAIISDDCS